MTIRHRHGLPRQDLGRAERHHGWPRQQPLFTARQASAHRQDHPVGRVPVHRTPTINRPQAITAALDGNLWFTSHDNDRIGKITTTGAIAVFPWSTPAWTAPTGITAGGDGKPLVHVPSNNRIGRITTTGVITTFANATHVRLPLGITSGPDGATWYANSANSSPGASARPAFQQLPRGLWATDVGRPGRQIRVSEGNQHHRGDHCRGGRHLRQR